MKPLSDADLGKGTAASFLSALCYAVAVVFIRGAYDAGVAPGTALLLRFAIASLAMVAFLAIAGGWVKLSIRQTVALFLLGFLAYTLLGMTWYLAFRNTPAWLVSLLSALYPLATSLSSWLFLGERPDRRQTLALGLVLIGGVALFWRPFEPVVLTGVLLMVANIVVRVAYLLVGDRWTRGVPPVISTTWMVVGAAAGTFIYALIVGQLAFDFQPMGWLWLSLFGVVSTAMAIVFLWRSVGLIGPSLSAIVGSAEPVFAVLIAVLVLGERMTAWHVVGCCLMLAGTVLVRFGA